MSAGALRLKLPLGFVPPLLVALSDAFERTTSLSPRGRCLGLTWERAGRGFDWGKGKGGKLDDDEATSPSTNEAVASGWASSACAGALP